MVYGKEWARIIRFGTDDKWDKKIFDVREDVDRVVLIYEGDGATLDNLADVEVFFVGSPEVFPLSALVREGGTGLRSTIEDLLGLSEG